MTEPESYSGRDYWDDYHAISAAKASTRRTGERIWITCFLPILETGKVRRILDLGCGSGADAIALARLSYEMTGNDISAEAIAMAREQARKASVSVDFSQHDLANLLPYPDAAFDAVICNLTLHMFPDSIARGIVAEVARCLRPGGLFLFHVNSTADIPYRTARQQPAVRLAPRFYRLGKGQTMRFFTEDCCRSLLAGWTVRQLDHIESRGTDGEIQKCAWRCVAEKASD